VAIQKPNIEIKTKQVELLQILKSTGQLNSFRGGVSGETPFDGSKG